MNQEESEALRAELEYRQQPVELNPQILKNVFKETGLKPDWQVDIIHFWRKIIMQPLELMREWGVGIIKARPANATTNVLIWEWGVVISASILVVMVLWLTILKPQPIVKSPPSIPQQIAVSNPQATAQTLQIDLAKLGIDAKLKTIDDDWIVEVIDLSTDNPEALSTLLTKHELTLPPPGESGLKIRILVSGR